MIRGVMQIRNGAMPNTMPSKAPSCDDGHEPASSLPHAARGVPAVEVLAWAGDALGSASTAGFERPSGTLGGSPDGDLTRRSIHAYPSEHLPLWRTLRAQARVAGWHDPVPPGAFGEHLLVRGVREHQAWIGDVWRFDSGCELAILEPRLPGPAFDVSMGFGQASRMMVESGTCGFMLVVKVPGHLSVGARAHVVPGPREVSIAELFRARCPATRR